MAIATLTQNETGANSLIDINANFVDLDTTKADLASPALTGNPTAPTQSASNNSTRIATTAYVDNQISVANVITVETTAGATHSLITTAGQKVIVWAKGTSVHVGTNYRTLELKYNGVTKDTVHFQPSGTANMETPFSLQYTETPGAATQNITVTANVGTLSDIVIIVMKIG